MAAPEDVNVDELRRRARRRLVGAIVLALAVAVLVPMLLESDPKPLGEDVSVKIPPVDEGKFVNRLNDKAKAEPAKGAVATTPADYAGQLRNYNPPLVPLAPKDVTPPPMPKKDADPMPKKDPEEPKKP